MGLLTNIFKRESTGSGDVATDVIWDAAGDLAVGTGANTAGRLAIGSVEDILKSDGTTGVWTSSPSVATLTVRSANSITLGTDSAGSGPAIGSMIFHNATNTNHFSLISGTTGAALSWTLPIAAPGGANYLLNVDADGTMGYTDPASLGGSGDVIAASNSQTWGSGAAATIPWIFNVSGTDTTFTPGNGVFGFSHSLNIPTGQTYNINGSAVVDQDVTADGNPSFSTINLVGTNSLNLGTAGSLVGGIRFKNATSGYVELLPPTGALGTGAITLPASGTLATTTQIPTATTLHVDDILTALGIASEATHFGTFTGVTIPDSSTAKAALQALETSLELKAPSSGIALSALANQAAQTVNANATDGAAAPTAVAISASQIVARLATGNIKGASAAEMKTLLGYYTSGDDISMNDEDWIGISGNERIIFRGTSDKIFVEKATLVIGKKDEIAVDGDDYSFRIVNDADSDGTALTKEVFDLSLTAAADPTAAIWDFTSTQSAGYRFDKPVTAPTFIGALTGTASGNLPLAGGTLTGELVTVASAAVAGAGLNLPHGVVPNSPVNGDVWTTTAGLYARINSGTVGPFGLGGSGDVVGPATTTQHKIPVWSATQKTLVDGVAPGTAGNILKSDGTDWGSSGTLEVSTINLPSSDAEPGTTAGQIRHDTVVTGSTNGALKWYDGATVRQIHDGQTSALKLATTGIVSGKIGVITKAAAYTLGTDDASEAYGYMLYTTAAAVITLPVAVMGMSVCVYTGSTHAISVKPATDGYITLNAVKLDQNHKVTNASTIGDFIALVCNIAGEWISLGRSGTWTDGAE